MTVPKRLVVIRFRRDRQKWEVDHPNPPGAGPRRSRPMFATEEEAHTYAAKVVVQLNQAATLAPDDAPLPDRSILLRDFIAQFLQDRAAELAPRTLAGYRASLARVPASLTGRRVADLRRRHIVGYLSALSDPLQLSNSAGAARCRTRQIAAPRATRAQPVALGLRAPSSRHRHPRARAARCSLTLRKPTRFALWPERGLLPSSLPPALSNFRAGSGQPRPPAGRYRAPLKHGDVGCRDPRA
jgi:hypothetical protein